MRSESSNVAEVSCLTKLQFESQNDLVDAAIDSSFENVEKDEIKGADASIAAAAVVENATPTISNDGDIEKGIRPDAESVTVTLAQLESKDDFPEGGLKG